MAISGSGEAPWQVRIRDDAGRVAGAGVLISTGHVLTCAHVVDRQAAESGRAATDQVTVPIDLPDMAGCGPLDARVMTGGWFPVGGHGEGDIAVLEFDRDVTGIRPARLSAPPSYMDRHVSVLGYPNDPPYGVWAEARLRGRSGPRWVQLDAVGRHRTKSPLSSAWR
jgi:V8-like Glu-specific endopeptidase